MIDPAYDRHFQRWISPILVCAGLAVQSSRGEAAPAQFWISLSGAATLGPEAPTLNLENGSKRTIYVWGRPATDGTNFKNLQNFSLNLVPSASSAAVYDIVNSFKVYNPGNRF